MQQNRIDNSIFLYAVTGVLLFISALAFIVAYSSGLAVLEMSYNMAAFVLFATSMSFLYKAIKNDRDRLREA